MADINIGIRIPSDKVEAAREGFLYLHPIPLGEDDQPIMSPVAWFKEWVRRKVRDEIARGIQAKSLAEVPFAPDDSVVVPD